MDPPSEPSAEFVLFEQVRGVVEAEFGVEDGFLEYGVPTFYVRMREDSKQAFLRVHKRLGPLGFAPILRKRENGRVVLQALRRTPARPSRLLINVVLFFAAVGTMLLTGYFYSLDVVDAVMFMASVMAILASHEIGHKLTASKHGVDASYPYFIPGPPPFGTFGAVIRQKSLAPNRDALFDLGASGPIIGFIVTTLVAIIGVQMSQISVVTELPPGTFRTPFLLDFLVAFLLSPPPVLPGETLLVQVNSVGYAAWIGALVTMLQLLPAGTLDGGHVARGLLGERARGILSVASMVVLALLGYLLMAMVVLFLSMGQHPGPLDDVSELSISRKLATIALVFIFVLCLTPSW